MLTYDHIHDLNELSSNFVTGELVAFNSKVEIPSIVKDYISSLAHAESTPDAISIAVVKDKQDACTLGKTRMAYPNTVVLNIANGAAHMVETLCHELTHLRQLRYSSDVEEVVNYYFPTEMSEEDQPGEVEARYMADNMPEEVYLALAKIINR